MMSSLRLPPSRKIQRTSFFFFGLLFLLYTFAPRYVGMGHASRYDLTKAIADDGVFHIDRYVENTIDWSSHGGHFYTNKAPGVSLLAVLPYFALTRGEKILGIDTTDWGYRNLRWTDVFVTAIPSVLLCVLLLFFLISQKSGTSGKPEEGMNPWIVVFTYALATNAFTFSTMLWAHQTAAAFLFAGFYILSAKKSTALAGLFTGLAVLTEYSTALAIPAFCLYLAGKSAPASRIKALACFALGGLLPLLVFAYYHKACFGGYLSLANQFGNPSFIESGKQFGVLGVPSLDVIFKLLIGIYRGLFLVSPVLIFAMPGFYSWIKNTEHRAEGLVALWIVASFLLFNSSFNHWEGGCSSGPRYLVPMLPFFAAALRWKQSSPLFKLSLLVSAINIGAIAAVDTSVCPDIRLLDVGIYPHLFDATQRWRPFLAITTVMAILYGIAHKSSHKPIA